MAITQIASNAPHFTASVSDDLTKIKYIGATILLDDGTWKIINADGTIGDYTSPNALITLKTSDIEIGAVEIKNATTDDRLIVNSDGSINNKQIPIINAPITLYSVITTVPSSPTEIVIGNISTIKIEISGTSTARTTTFGAKLTSTSTAINIQGFNLTTCLLALQTTGTSSELWEFSGLTGLYSLVLNPTVITGGNLTIKVVEVS